MRAQVGSLVLAGLVGAVSPYARAGVGFEDGTRLWQGPPAAEAVQRAERWAQAIGGRVVAVRSSPEEDEFAETLALLERAGPMPSGDDPLALLRREVGPLVPGAPEPIEASVARREGEQPLVVIGRFESEAVTYRTALVSTGPTHAIVVLAVQRGEDSLFRGRFTEALSRLRGVERPIWPFPRLVWRGLGGLLALGIAIGSWFVLVRRSSLRGIAAGLGAAAITVGAAVIAGAVAVAALGRAEASLALAGTTRGGVLADLVMAALAAAMLVLGLSLWQRTRERPIQSAPTKGPFAERLPAPAPPAMPETPLAAPTARETGHPDGPSVLDDPRIGADPRPPEGT